MAVTVIHAPPMVALEMVPSMFSKVLVLVVGLTLPVWYDEIPQNILDSFGILDSCSVGNEEIHGSPELDDIE